MKFLVVVINHLRCRHYRCPRRRRLRRRRSRYNRIALSITILIESYNDIHKVHISFFYSF